MKSILLIGHRGVGKTSLGKRLQKYFSETTVCCEIIDLDNLIEEQVNKSIPDIWKESGEKFFRELEESIFSEKILADEAFSDNIPDSNRRYRAQALKIVSLGAGFGFSEKLFEEVKEKFDIYWVRRITDQQGRVFLDRPFWGEEKSPLEDYMSRHDQRNHYYQEVANKIYLMPEGQPNEEVERSLFLGGENNTTSGAITVYRNQMDDLDNLVEEVLQQKIKFIELRNDWLSEDEIKRVVNKFNINGADKLIYSYRDEKSCFGSHRKFGIKTFDWPLELLNKGNNVIPAVDEYFILSCHDRLKDESLSAGLKRLVKASNEIKADHLKAAFLTNDYVELDTGDSWFTADSEKRSYLPRSKNGRWNWYRAYKKNQMKINFFKLGWIFNRESRAKELVDDQPSLTEWRMSNQENQRSSFAAVLGSPVCHSRTPTEHFSYFQSNDKPVFKIDVQELEWESAIRILSKMGLVSAAVTSPLKSKAAELINSKNPINTLFFSNKENKWLGENTDVDGLRKLFLEKNISTKNIVVWGGGGVIAPIKVVLDEMNSAAQFYSARSGENKSYEKPSGQIDSPEVLIWAVGRGVMNNCLWPRKEWNPKIVIDLNYAEDSPGIEYARKVGADYVSGIVMFKEQAAKQIEFWSKNEC